MTLTREEIAKMFDVPIELLALRQPEQMATEKNTPKQSAPVSAVDEVDMAEVERFALARGQRVNNGIDSGVVQAYLADKARRAAGTES
jgi:hypothetical protein